MSLTVVHVVGSTRADHGGPSRSVPALCEALDTQEVDVHLVTAAPSEGDDTAPIRPGGGVETHLIPEDGPLAAALRSPLGFYRRLQRILDRIEPDLLHDHGAWLPSNVLAAWFARRHGLPLVVSPRGMVTDWALSHHAGKKRVAWALYQKWAFRQAALFHVTAPAEAGGLRDMGFSQPAAVLPNGVPVNDATPAAHDGAPRRVLFLSRLHPKKGLPMLLEAWDRVRPDGWVLELVGPDADGHRAALETQAGTLGLDGTVTFSGPVDDTEKWNRYAMADLFVLPTHSENFGIVVAEALAAGVPVLTTKGAPWAELEEADCGWWVDAEVDALEEALRSAVACTPDERRAMGERGRTLVAEQYSWAGVAERMRTTYQWLLQGQSTSYPDWIQTATHDG